MALILFHGPNDSNECRRLVRRLARELGGKFSYNSFWDGRNQRWFSPDTVGKAAYAVRVDDAKIETRSNLVSLIRKIRLNKELVSCGLHFIRADYHHFEGPLAKSGFYERWKSVHHHFWTNS